MSNQQNDIYNEQRQEAQGHTPGPWRVKQTEGQFYVSPAVDQLSEENQEANASLIAAAPELLEACRIALQGLEDYGHNKEWENNLIADIRTLQAAIAKAEGK